MNKKDTTIFIIILLMGIDLILIGSCFHFMEIEQGQGYNQVLSFLPEKDKFYEVCEEEYISGVYDCSNKAGKYARHLIDKGYKNTKIMIVSMPNYDNNHAIVEVTLNDGSLTYIDPTWCIYGPKAINSHKFEYYLNKEQLYSWESYN